MYFRAHRDAWGKTRSVSFGIDLMDGVVVFSICARLAGWINTGLLLCLLGLAAVYWFVMWRCRRG